MQTRPTQTLANLQSSVSSGVDCATIISQQYHHRHHLHGSQSGHGSRPNCWVTHEWWMWENMTDGSAISNTQLDRVNPVLHQACVTWTLHTLQSTAQLAAAASLDTAETGLTIIIINTSQGKICPNGVWSQCLIYLPLRLFSSKTCLAGHQSSWNSPWLQTPRTDETPDSQSFSTRQIINNINQAGILNLDIRFDLQIRRLVLTVVSWYI